MVSIAGAATVLSFAVVAEYFPREFAARSNGALNVLHFGWAFAFQYGIGIVVGQWPSQEGHYPVVAYQTALGLGLVFQMVGFVWFAAPWIQILGRRVFGKLLASPAGGAGSSVDAPIPEACADGDW